MTECSQQLSRCHLVIFIFLQDIEVSPVHFYEFFSGVLESGRVPTIGGLSGPLYLPHGATGGRACKTLCLDAMLEWISSGEDQETIYE
ncbi:hypothetical protein DPMN_085719 [Dreissena polymorpha]|uniref:Uncharacterized protein n=1 Tax=Dreissena polymorpha TaxID=45954 RepID=A0A9D4BJN6_DREPO|nr:hypothetical protein DPMN_085719 [Dreissena polymorpha]